MFVYALIEPGGALSDFGAVRYIGATAAPAARLQQHIGSAKGGTGTKDKWVKGLLDGGQRPELVTIESCAGYPEAGEREEFWIRQYLLAGADLCNVKAGGLFGKSIPHHFDRFRGQYRIPLDQTDCRLVYAMHKTDGWSTGRIADLFDTPSDTIAVILAQEYTKRLLERRAAYGEN